MLRYPRATSPLRENWFRMRLTVTRLTEMDEAISSWVQDT